LPEGDPARIVGHQVGLYDADDGKAVHADLTVGKVREKLSGLSR
jgi:hypothetical protein